MKKITEKQRKAEIKRLVRELQKLLQSGEVVYVER